MAEDFGVGELIHNGDYYDLVNDFISDLPFYRDLCKSIDGQILELCCGTGRLTIPLAKSGAQITGVDSSESMLSRAKIKANRENLNIDFFLQDIRELNLNHKFEMIFIPFNSLQNIYAVSDLERILAKIKVHLTENGLFVFDIFNPDISLMYESSLKEHKVKEITNENNEHILIKEKCNYDPAAQVNRVTWYYHKNENIIEQKLDMRCYFPLEMDMLLKYNGFEIISKYGDFDKNQFTGESLKQIFLCKAA
jgi:SAM-dependent methyltransferase